MAEETKHGLEGVPVAETGLSDIDGDVGRLVYRGIPIDMYTPIFAMSRVGGWIGHVLEYQADNRLIRPRARYVGPQDAAFVPLAER